MNNRTGAEGDGHLWSNACRPSSLPPGWARDVGWEMTSASREPGINVGYLLAVIVRSTLSGLPVANTSIRSECTRTRRQWVTP